MIVNSASSTVKNQSITNSLNQKHSESDATRVSVLSEALPYIQKFAGRRIVVKYGGAAMASESLKTAVFRDIALL